MFRKPAPVRRAFSFAELLVVVVLMGILAAIVVPKLTKPIAPAKNTSCDVNRRNIEIQAQRWYRTHGTWPAADLSDIGADKDYFPEGLPTCPVDGSNYSFDSVTEQIPGHAH